MKVFQDPFTGNYYREDGNPGYACAFCGNGYATAATANDRDIHACTGPDFGDTATCITCTEDIRLDDNGNGLPIWVHTHGSTVCYDNPPGTIDGDILHTAFPAP